VRVFMQWPGARATPAPEAEGAWKRATPENMAGLSAVAWYFGKPLHDGLKIPVGLVVSAVGGTNIISWSGPAAFAANSQQADKVKRIAELQAEFGGRVDDRGFEAKAFDDSAWKEMPAPGEWEKAGLASINSTG